MRRREFITLIGSAAVLLPRATRAQQQGLPVVGFLSARSPAESAADLAAFRQGLGQTGYFEGKNLAMEYRWAEARYDRLPAMAAELVARQGYSHDRAMSAIFIARCTYQWRVSAR